MTELTLAIDGQAYGGWQFAHIARGIQQFAGSFELLVTERWAGASTARPIRPGQAATLTLDGLPAISGWVDAVQPQYDAGQHAVTITGRDKAGDLVDCAAIAQGGAYSNRTLAQIATDLCKPFGIGVKVLTSVGAAFPTWRIEPGETVMETLDRASRYRGVLLMSDGQGNLLITQPGTAQAPAALVLGQNVKGARGKASWEKRFSEYVVKAQHRGSDDAFGDIVAAPAATVKDAVVTRYRPTMVLAEEQADAAACKIRANWQRTVMAARSQSVIHTVQGWVVDGKPWLPNTTVSVTDSYMGINDTMLIVHVDNYLDANVGERTDLTLMGKDAFDPIKLPQPSPAEGLF